MNEGRAPNPLVDQFRRGGVPPDLRLLAAQGALPLKPADLVELLHLLLRDTQPEVRDTAAATLLAQPLDEMLGIGRDRETPRGCPRLDRGPAARARAARGRAAEHEPPGRRHPGARWLAVRGAGRAGRHQPDAPVAQHSAPGGARGQPEPQQRPAASPARAARDLQDRAAARGAAPAAAAGGRAAAARRRGRVLPGPARCARERVGRPRALPFRGRARAARQGERRAAHLPAQHRGEDHRGAQGLARRAGDPGARREPPGGHERAGQSPPDRARDRVVRGHEEPLRGDAAHHRRPPRVDEALSGGREPGAQPQDAASACR